MNRLPDGSGDGFVGSIFLNGIHGASDNFLNQRGWHCAALDNRLR